MIRVGTSGWTYRHWKADFYPEGAPPQFHFAVKVSRLVTHVRRLAACGEIRAWLFRELEPLNEKICATPTATPARCRPCSRCRTPGPSSRRSADE